MPDEYDPLNAAWDAVPARPARPAEAPPPDPEPAPPITNGHADVPFARTPSAEPDPADLRDWSTGTEALSRLPLRERLSLTGGLIEDRARWLEELQRAEGRIDRLRYDTEAMLESGIGTRTGARFLVEISTDPPPPLLIGRLDPAGHTILYGTGGVGKGSLASSWIVALLESNRRVLVIDYENHPDEWARRIAGQGAGDLLDRVLHVAPLTAAWGGKRGAIWDQIDDLRRLSLDFGADAAVVDSIVPACAGSDPLKPEASSLYAGALEYIGLPTLSLAHVTKSDDLRYPFGSIFWHNLARVTWSLKSIGGGLLLTHRKHNNYEKVAAKRVETTWTSAGVLGEVWERDYSEFLSQRISAVLREGSMTPTQIADRLNDELDDDEAEPIKPESVKKALVRGSRGLSVHFARVSEGGGRGRESAWRNA